MMRLLAAAIAVVAIAGCGKAPEKAETPRPVKVAKALPASGGLIGVFAGEIRPRYEADLAFRVGGKILARPADLGERVKKGDLLARLDPEDLRLNAAAARAQVAQAEADHAFARAELERYRALLEQKYISQAAFDAKKNAHDASAAKRDATRAQASVSGNQAEYAELRADHAGVITAVNAEPGQVVNAGQAVVRLARLEDLDAVFSVAESQVQALRDTKTVRVSLWSRPDRYYEGRVRDIAAAADPAARTYLVKVAVDNADDALKLGMTANVVLTGDDKAAQGGTLLPLTALTQQGEQAAVLVVRPDNVLELRPVKVRQYRETAALVEAGVQPGETVVAAGVHKLRAGQAVQPLADGVLFGSDAPRAPRAAAKPL
jgi:RND family efflux transporter MFP subunit